MLDVGLMIDITSGILIGTKKSSETFVNILQSDYLPREGNRAVVLEFLARIFARSYTSPIQFLCKVMVGLVLGNTLF